MANYVRELKNVEILAHRHENQLIEQEIYPKDWIKKHIQHTFYNSKVDDVEYLFDELNVTVVDDTVVNTRLTNADNSWLDKILDHGQPHKARRSTDDKRLFVNRVELLKKLDNLYFTTNPNTRLEKEYKKLRSDLSYLLETHESGLSESIEVITDRMLQILESIQKWKYIA